MNLVSELLEFEPVKWGTDGSFVLMELLLKYDFKHTLKYKKQYFFNLPL